MGLLMLVGVLLMIVILLHRGRGGGLAGAFGGAGGQSAFGTRAGDVFTKITAFMAIFWVFLAGVSRFALEPAANQAAEDFKTKAEIEEQNNPEGLLKNPGATSPGGQTQNPPPAKNVTPEENKPPQQPADKDEDMGKSSTPSKDDDTTPKSDKAPVPGDEPPKSDEGTQESQTHGNAQQTRRLQRRNQR